MTRNPALFIFIGLAVLGVVYISSHQPSVGLYALNRGAGSQIKYSAAQKASSDKHVINNSATAFEGGGTVELPDEPETQGYAPSSIKDFEAADPTTGISMISVPSANSLGNAVMRFNMNLPRGRQGLEPDISITYNNEGGPGWMGIGWNLTSPAISLDTRWGVPRYDAAKETEMYTLNGEQLAPINNRDTLIARVAEKRFFTRVESEFHKIIRHGDNPKNYWWEVDEKNGKKSYFGGKPGTGVIDGAVLKDDANNIAYWGLVETRDLYGNFVNYDYETVQNAGIIGGTVIGRQLYLSHVYYTGNGNTNGPYGLEFVRDRTLGETQRRDVTIDARQGFKMVTADLLRKVKITFNGDLIRSYDFSYTQGAFFKTLLKSIKELDNSDSVFYHQDFNYYDDVRTNPALNDSDYKSSDTGQNWQVASDNLKGDIVNPLPGFEDQASVIGTTTVDSKSAGVVVTVGTIVGDLWSKNLTAGGGPIFGLDDQREITSLIDINGDGLPDKVFIDGGNVYYRPNLGAGTHSFGDKRQVLGIHTFGTSTTNSIGGGVQALPGAGFFGYIHTDATTTQKIYFSDFNGDGLIDLASEGTVYFNHINAQGDPEFTPDSKLTPSPIGPGLINPAFLQPDTALQRKQELKFPLQDIIRFWEAPDSGFINITAPVALQNVPNTTGSVNNKKDGVRVSIQLAGTPLWTDSIGPADFSTHNPTGITGLHVTKGERVYFRLQSIYNGEDDLVSWDPIIQYTTSVTAQSDFQHKISNYYRASEDFILHSRSVTGMGKPGSIIVDGTFKKEITSDSVFIEVTRNRAGVITNFFERGFSGNDTFDGVMAAPGQLAVDTGDQLHFALVSHSYTDRSAIQWVPHYAFVAITDGTPVTTTTGSPTLEGFPIPDNSNFNYWKYAAPPVTVAQQDTVILWPQVPGGGTGTLWFSIKGNDTVYARRQVMINGGTMSTAMDSIKLIRKAGEPLFMEFATDTFEFAATLAPPFVQVFMDSTYTDSTGAVRDTTVPRGSIAANLYCNPQVEYLGAMYRGWGGFGFKGDKGNVPIDETKLNLNEFNSYPTDPNAYTDSASMASQPDPSQANFVTLFPDIQKQEWLGYDTSVYITAGYMSSSRLYMHDVSVDTLGVGAGAINKVSITSINSYSLGISAGGIGPSGGKSDASTTIVSDMMDMNGDRYPDVISGGASLTGFGQDIQYTMPNGGLGNTTISHAVSLTQSSGNQLGIGFGGEFEKAFTGNKTQKAAAGAENVAKGAVGLSGSINQNYDATGSSWVDINGDGLPDRIFDNGNVMLNLGYKFAAPEAWQVFTIDAGSSFSEGGGAGININGGSFEGGFGISRTQGRNSSIFADINGDGLPDQLILSGNNMTVRFNTGNGFTAPIPWRNFDDIAALTSIGESYNLAITIAIDIPIIFLKIAINPDANIGHGTARQEKAWIDLDGDGFADYVQSKNDGQLFASSSAIGRTNMLRTVTSPIGGGSFKMDYQRVGNTYNMPQSKWVLKDVTVFDGVTGDGVDTMRKQFIYEDGYQDRNEREFYGFHQVTTLELNTADQNKVYRSHIQQFYNNSYYNKGLLASDWIQDSAGHKFTQTNYTYDMRPLEDSIVFPALIRTEKMFYEGAVTADVRSVINYQYDEFGNVTQIKDTGDGSPQDMKITNIAYHSNDALYIKSIPSSVIITTPEGEKRKRTTTLNANNEIAKIKDYLEDGSSANTDIEYDSYGNVTRLTKPANYKNQRMSYALEYDNTVHGYPVRITDAWGYITTTEYDYRFGEAIHTVSRNNEETKYTLDNLGRITKFIGPYEVASGKPYTIAIDYHPEAKVPYTITRHYDPEYGDDINVYNFVDGLGRSIQLKKQVSIFKGKDQPDDLKMVVSGTLIFDAFGRVDEQYYPVVENIGTANANLNESFGKLHYIDTYDAVDRLVKRTLADNATTSIDYTSGGGYISKLVTDALGHKRETLYDQRGRKRAFKVYRQGGALTTRYDYDALNEMIKVTDTKGNSLTATYDNLGMRTSVNHPDAGRTEFQYDLAGNLLKKITAEIRKEIPDGGAIQYSYDYDRVTDIDYPRNYQNKVKYTYGAAGTGSKAGRVILQEDGSGGQEFFYSMQGQIVKVIRTVLTSPQFATTYVSEQQYDSWNRLKKMIYPDGEQIFYHYNKSGGLLSMDGAKIGSSYQMVNQVGYDEYDERVYMRYANGTENFYNYDDKRRRLAQLRATSPTGTEMMNNAYKYDEVSNLLGVVNSVQATGGSTQDYIYDDLDRLDSASGQFGTATKYGLKYGYDNLSNILQKTMNGATSTSSYDHSYTYGGSSPHQATQIGTNKYNYDLNGNQLGYGDIENFYDEENRLMGVINKGVLSQYTYDADDNRVVKSSGGMQNLWINGAPAGAVNHGDNYTVYVSPYVVAKKSEFTKHYYIDGQRVASQLGHGTFTNISFPTSGLTAGGVDYAKRAALIEKARNDYYASLGVSPGPPTDKNFWAQPQNNGIAAPVFVDTTASNVPTGWPGNTTTPPVGPPVFVDTIPSRDSVKAGYGFQDAGHFYEGGIFYYHFDDQGSTAYVTDFTGKVVQHVEYAPSGESILSEQNGSFASVYLFKGKGYDEETGYYFFGPQYYDPVLSQWLNLPDPSGEGFLSESMDSYGQAGDLGDDDEEMVTNPDIEEIEYSGSRETENEWGESKAKSEEAESKEKRRQSNKPRRNAIANKYSNMLFELKYNRKKAREMFGEWDEESEVLDGNVYKGGANVQNGHAVDIDKYDGEDAFDLDDDDMSDYDMMGNAKSKPQPRKAAISVSGSRSNSRYTNYGIGLLRKSISRAPSEVVIHRGSFAADVIIHRPSAVKKNSLNRNSLNGIRRSASGRKF